MLPKPSDPDSDTSQFNFHVKLEDILSKEYSEKDADPCVDYSCSQNILRKMSAVSQNILSITNYTCYTYDLPTFSNVGLSNGKFRTRNC
jgi:hypothetical protein